MLIFNSEKNKQLIKVALLCLIFLTIIVGVIIYILPTKAPKKASDSTVSIKKVLGFPLTTSESAGFAYRFYCTTNKINNENTEFIYGEGKFDHITFKLTADCTYKDITNEEQKIVVPLGSIIENENGSFYAYADKSFYAYPVEIPSLLTGEKIKDRIEEYVNTNYNRETEFSLDLGTLLKITIINGENKFANANTLEPNGSSDFIYYGSGFTKSWKNMDFEQFIKTGNKQFLPELPDGRKFIPALRVSIEIGD